MLHKIVITGEGITDMGACKNGQPICSGEQLNAGPIARLLFKLIQHHLPDWNIDNLELENPATHMTLIDGADLKARSKAKKNGLIRPSKAVQRGMVEHARRAQVLADYALENDYQMATYFHDTDGTRSQLADMPDRQEVITLAIKAGFRAAQFEKRGLALVPKPTSEAWLICGAKEMPYQNCDSLERELSGNDSSPDRSPKMKLGELIGNPDYSRSDLHELVEQIDVTQINMPSFNSLREQVQIAIWDICGDVDRAVVKQQL